MPDFVATTEFTGDGVTTVFAIGWTYNEPTDVVAYVDGVNTPFTFLNDSALQFSTAPASGTLVRVRRETDLTNPTVDFTDGTPLTEEDLDTMENRLRFGIQETRDIAFNSLASTVAGQYDALNRRIVNVADPVDPQDVVTKSYADQIPAQVEASSQAAAASAAAAANSAVATAALVGTVETEVEDILSDAEALALRAEAAAAAVDPITPERAVDVIGLTINPTVTSFATRGYHSVGDGGHGFYVRVASTPDHNLYLTSADGAIWELIEHIRVTDKQAGAVGDGVADDTSAIQSAIDYVIYNSQTGRRALAAEVLLTGSLLRITNTIHLGYGSVFERITVRGTSPGFRAEPTFPGVNIVVDFPAQDRPIFSISGCRATILKDVWVEGMQDWSSFDFDDPASTDDAYWEALGGAGRNNAQAIVVIDGYRPGSVYPADSYNPPSWVTNNFGNAGVSSDIHLENVRGRRVNTAILNGPTGSVGNGDFITIRKCYFEQTMYLYSGGQHQTRNVKLEDTNWLFVKYVLANDVHGLQQGRLNGSMDNCSGAVTENLFRFNTTSIVGAMTFRNVYNERLWRIGTISGNTGVEKPLAFRECTFGLRSQSDGRGVPATLLGGTGTAAIDFDLCEFNLFPSVLHFEPPNTRLNRCVSRPTERESGTVSRTEAVFHNATMGGIVTDPAELEQHSIDYKVIDTVTGVVGSGALVEPNKPLPGSGRNFNVPIWIREFQLSGERGSLPLRYARDYFSRNQTDFANVSVTDREVTFDITLFTSGTIDDNARRVGLNPGDVVREKTSGMIFRIKSRSVLTITMVAETGYTDDGAGNITLDQDFSGSFTIETMVANISTPTRRMICDFTQNNNVLPARDTRNLSAFVGTDFVAGDCLNLYLDDDAIQFASELLITDAISGQLTVSGPVRESAVRKLVPTFFITPPPNEV